MISLKSGGKIMSSKKKGDLDMNYSPLRYPGGKSKIAPFISLIIEKINIAAMLKIKIGIFAVDTFNIFVISRLYNFTP